MLRFLVFLALFAAVVYAVFWLIDRRNQGQRPGGGTDGTGRPTPRGPVGPDDDEDFLRELDRKRRRKHTEPPEDV